MPSPVCRPAAIRRREAGLAAVLASALVLAAAPAAAGDDGRPSDERPPSCEEAGVAAQVGALQERRGVHEREFLKRGRVALAPRGGLFAADLMSSSYLYGGELTVYLTERLGLFSSLEVTPVALDLERPLGEFFGDDRFERELGALALGGVTLSPIHAKLRTSGRRVIHADLHLSAGAGRLFHSASQGVALAAGVALELFTTSWFTLRFDVRDVMTLQEAAGETGLAHNVAATGGISIWLPSAW